jgi:HSP20 family protein
LEDLQDRMGQLVRSVFGDLSGSDGAGQRGTLAVPVDIEETDDGYVVEVDLPNVSSDDVSVELRDNELRISGEYRQRERTGVLRRQTRRIGQFEYVVALPGELDADKVDATLSDGVLTVRVGKAVASQPRRIEVKGS